ncbi:valine--tRNA ligase [Patescibacteria group bacterium]|jgi:valyl-tRNA synthetase|nr:valine--tRNA ligase [Patescibacteria group bacterium]
MNKQDNFSLAKAYEPQVYENDIYKIWEESGFFNPDNLSATEKPFVISMPPPNATGILHLGHASALAYEDLMIRYKRLRGFETLWLPGTDHAAIATQTKLEKILASEGTDRHALGREKFIERVKEFIAGSRDTIKEQTKKMGSSCDWSREAYTFSDELSRAVNTAFVSMYNDGLIYRGLRIVNWCPRCASTLADDEVEYQEQLGKLYYIKYGPFTVATTRPETKLADTGVAVHPEDERYKAYLGQELDIDLAGHKIRVKVFADSQVDPEFGSGAIGVTPAHSAVDYEFAQKNNLKSIKLIDEQGKILASGGKYAGLDVQEARTKFVADLESAGLLLKVEDYENNLSVCYRCSAAIEPLTSEQWFVAVDKKIPSRQNKTLKELSIEAVRSGEIKILPDRFEKIYYHWMENLHDWCISRQIWWGHRIPVWYTADQKLIVAHDEAEAEKLAGGQKISQDPDTLDTWFSSSLWTFSTLGWPNETVDLKKFHPTSVMETGYDILFFWVARMILMSEYLLGTKPFETVYLHGMIRDKEGKKMSKSLGNGIDPIDMINLYGTDALRLSLISGAAPGADLKLYEEKIAGSRNFVNKLWNISRFIFSQTENIYQVVSEPQVTDKLDQAILSKFNKLVKEVTEHLDKYEFSIASVKLYQFTWTDFADSYVEIAKKQGNKEDILLYILERLLKLWHPFLPYVTEVIWRQFDTKTLLLVETWPKQGAQMSEDAILYFDGLVEIISRLRELKAENKIAPSEFPLCKIVSEQASSEHLQLIADLARVKLSSEDIDVEPEKIWECSIYINLKKAMSAKEKEELEKYIKNLEEKLSNDSFVKNAPAQVVGENQKKLAEAKQKLASN